MNREFVTFAGLMLSRRAPGLAMLLLRLLAGGLMMTHGLAKIANFATLAPAFSDPIGLGPTTSLVMIIFAEAGCSLLLILGLFTRLALIPLMFGMTIAAFFTFPEFALGQSELAILYLGIYAALFLIGPGRFSFDGWMWSRLEKQVRKANVSK